MSVRIEWFTATSTSIDVLFATDEASDGQRAIDDGGTPQTITVELGNGGGGAAITGTPDELLAFLTEATDRVTAHQAANPEGDEAFEHGQIVEWTDENGNTMRDTVIAVDYDERIVILDVADPNNADAALQLTIGEVVPVHDGNEANET